MVKGGYAAILAGSIPETARSSAGEPAGGALQPLFVGCGLHRHGVLVQQPAQRTL
jgi:hypothetical protein